MITLLRRIFRRRRCRSIMHDLNGKRMRCGLPPHATGKHHGRDYRGEVTTWGERSPSGIVRIVHGGER